MQKSALDTQWWAAVSGSWLEKQAKFCAQLGGAVFVERAAVFRTFLGTVCPRPLCCVGANGCTILGKRFSPEFIGDGHISEKPQNNKRSLQAARSCSGLGWVGGSQKLVTVRGLKELLAKTVLCFLYQPRKRVDLNRAQKSETNRLTPRAFSHARWSLWRGQFGCVCSFVSSDVVSQTKWVLREQREVGVCHVGVGFSEFVVVVSD